MTEEEWLTATNPYWLIHRIGTTTSTRKVRLWAVARCFRVWELLVDVRCREAVVLAERYADGLATNEDLNAMAHRLNDWWREERTGDLEGPYGMNTLVRMCSCCLIQDGLGGDRCSLSISGVTNTFHFPVSEADGVRAHDIFGNPFRPIAIDPSWLTSTVLTLAEGIYADKTFDQLSILADALQDAECDNDELLTHLRSSGPHVRGCWALDLVLGKS